MSTRPSRKQIAGVIASQMDKETMPKLAKETAEYLLRNKRTNELSSLMRDVLAIRAKSGTVEATASSARKLSNEISNVLMKLATEEHPSYERIILNKERDPSLIGGVRLTTIDRQLDLSISGRLNRLTLGN